MARPPAPGAPGLFNEGEGKRPLAARMRPNQLADLVGLGELLAETSWLRAALAAGRLPSMVLYGPSGTGKTTLARILAAESMSAWVGMNAVTATVQDLRQVLAESRQRLAVEGKTTILFLDEIHRLNRAQQEVLLPDVEDGSVVLIGTTAGNPFFDLSRALLSRVRTVSFAPLADEEVSAILTRALTDPTEGLGAWQLQLDDPARSALFRYSGGDARVALNLLEAAATRRHAAGGQVVSAEDVEDVRKGVYAPYDRAGDEHYHTISAFIKSVRGSDADAAMLWLTKMLALGEEPRFIARRLVILAVEDVGLADPEALPYAMSVAQGLELIGLPEGELLLAAATLRLALAPKSNSAKEALARAHQVVQGEGRLLVPAHLRNLSGQAKREADATNYRYPHDFPDHWVAQDYWAEGVAKTPLYRPQDSGQEGDLNRRRPGADRSP
ncbi:MAG: replication-associated recombination protein A [Sulfobacillus sp.]